ncbi:lysozyme inhibitor LprI family protein [Pararhodospirillum oryzae]|uniref:lysozyme inhibitor LprI family protein n=1 Tax=Pararhodospirillum oryzae TaxID=478448 RepID=UPI00157FD576|nr:lysozyme inhibitor LprI family protein [Pararhodospirillum oryzae]
MSSSRRPGGIGKGLGALLALASLAGASPAGAAQPGFDCDKATSVAERVICADGGLAARDRALSDAFAARKAALAPDQVPALVATQRAWLKARDKACSLPAALPATEDVTLDLLWRVAPCLAGVYDQRLAELGAPPPAPPSARIKDPGFIHPLCLAAALPDIDEGVAAPVPLALCNQGNAHNPPQENPDGTLSAEATPQAPAWAWVASKDLGDGANGRRLALVTVNGGGTGYFSSLVAIERDLGPAGEPRITVETVRGGGDRCSGGIQNARREGTGVILDINVTPVGLMEAASAQTIENEPILAGMSDCAICCVATLVTRINANGANETLVEARLDPQTDWSVLETSGSQADRCVARLLHRPGLLALDPPSLQALGAAFDACVSTPAAKGRQP